MKFSWIILSLVFLSFSLDAQSLKHKHSLSIPLIQLENGIGWPWNTKFRFLKGLRYQFQFDSKWGIFSQATLRNGYLGFTGIDTHDGGPVNEHTFKIGVERRWFTGKLKLISQVSFYSEQTKIEEGFHYYSPFPKIPFSYSREWKGLEAALGIQYQFAKNWSVVAISATQFGIGTEQSWYNELPARSDPRTRYFVSHWLESLSIRYSFGGRKF